MFSFRSKKQFNLVVIYNEDMDKFYFHIGKAQSEPYMEIVSEYVNGEYEKSDFHKEVFECYENLRSLHMENRNIFNIPPYKTKMVLMAVDELYANKIRDSFINSALKDDRKIFNLYNTHDEKVIEIVINNSEDILWAAIERLEEVKQVSIPVNRMSIKCKKTGKEIVGSVPGKNIERGISHLLLNDGSIKHHMLIRAYSLSIKDKNKLFEEFEIKYFDGDVVDE